MMIENPREEGDWNIVGKSILAWRLSGVSFPQLAAGEQAVKLYKAKLWGALRPTEREHQSG